MTIELEPAVHYRCDVCGRGAAGESTALPPRGFAALEVHPLTGAGETAHACVGSCLVQLAERFAHRASRIVRPPGAH